MQEPWTQPGSIWETSANFWAPELHDSLSPSAVWLQHFAWTGGLLPGSRGTPRWAHCSNWDLSLLRLMICCPTGSMKWHSRDRAISLTLESSGILWETTYALQPFWALGSNSPSSRLQLFTTDFFLHTYLQKSKQWTRSGSETNIGGERRHR